MDTRSNPLPFAVWIAQMDLLCLDAWGIDAYGAGPQPWLHWHASSWTPDRALLELSTPTAPPDIEENLCLLSDPTVTTKIKELLMDTDEIEIALRYLDMEQETLINVFATREDKIRALARLGIAVTPDQSPLIAWMLAMCRENNLPETIPNTTIGEVANQLCPKWIWWLA